MGEVSLREASELLGWPYSTVLYRAPRWLARGERGIRCVKGAGQGRSRGGVRWYLTRDFVRAVADSEIPSVLHVRR